MGDRIRIGEFLALVGTVGLLVALAATKWFRSDVMATAAKGAVQGRIHGQLLSSAGQIGWFAFALVLFALVAGIVFFLRALTSRGPERVMLQAPVFYVLSGIAFLTLVWRLFLFRPGLTEKDVADSLPRGVRVLASQVDTTLHGGAWLGFASVTLMMLGTWFAMYDERSGSKAAKARTAALLADVPVRAVPHVPAPAEAEAAVVADDAIGTDPTTPSSTTSEGS